MHANKRRTFYGDKFLSDTISYSKDIKPHRLIQLHAGVGSGKNYFINRLIKGYQENLPDGTVIQHDPLLVLVITSRRSKVNELLTEEDLPADEKIGLWDTYHMVCDDNFPKIEPTGKHLVLEDEWGTHNVFQRSVVCTNAFIERYLQYRYKPLDITTHLWELFDLIVIDEAHSLILDASYQSAPFYVMELINEFIRRHRLAESDPVHHKSPRCGNLLLMTGSTAPMHKLTLPAAPYVIDRMDTCINVVPQNIHFMTCDEAKNQLVQQLEAGGKAVYFTNHTPVPSEFTKDTNVDPNRIAISFSKKESRDRLAKNDPAVFERMVRVEDSIAKTGLIPDDIHLWLTTSRNKEGINIANTDIEHLYVESHIQSDIIQMAGRIRAGVKHMYVILDSPGNYTPEWANLADFCRQELVASTPTTGTIYDSCNDYLESLCISNNILELFNRKNARQTAYGKKCKPIAEYIDYAHETFPYVRYSYLDNVFRFYEMREISRKLQKTELSLFSDAVEAPERLNSIFKRWFPTSTVHPYISEEEAQNQAARAYLTELGVTDMTKWFDKAACDNMRAELNKIYGENKTRLNALVKRCLPLRLRRVSNSKGTTDYEMYLVEPLDIAS